MEAQAKERERQAAAGPADESLKHTIAAAELYMQAAQKAKAKDDRVRLSRKCKELITQAERLKLVAANPDPPGPKSTRELSTSEKVILLASSKIHGKVFPPWEYPPKPADFAKAEGKDLFTDPSAYSFSPSQQRLFAGWRRPRELMGGGGVAGDDATLEQGLMRASADSDLVQDMVTDCSVVASLSAAMRHLCPSKGSLLKSLMYPFNHDAFTPALSESGKYVFRMHFNGCVRQVVIDDRLPASSSPSQGLFVVDRRNPRLVWPALMEKAYLKIRGGYDFPGSNSGTDLYVLTGWIPEQLFLHSDDFDIDRTWYSMRSSHRKGNVIATLGTPNLSAEEEITLGLVSEHDYAVMDVKEAAGDRLLLVKNPWRDSVIWKGVGPSRPIKSDDGLTGTFWISFEDVVQNFDSLYLNWNPTLFSRRQDHHFTWENPPKTVLSALAHNPQYTLRTSSSSPVWILLSRHWQDGELDILRDDGDHVVDHHHSRTVPASLASVSKTLGFMALQVHSTTSPPGCRVLLPDRSPLYSGPLVDSPHTLLRLDSPTPDKAYTVVVTQCDLPLEKYSFTLSFLSLDPVTVSLSPEPFLHNQSLTSAWTRRTAGGSPTSGTYHTNPAWSITIPSPTPLSLLLTTSNPDLPIHISLSYPPPSSSTATASTSSGPPSRRDTLLSSPEYTRGAAHAHTDGATLVPAGTYVAVASTFTPGHQAPFVLRIGSAVPVLAQPLANSEAGRLRCPAPRLLLDLDSDLDSDSDRPRSRSGQNPLYRAPLDVRRLTRLSLVARSAPGSPCALRVSVEAGRGPHRTVLAAAPRGEGEFVGAAAGLRTEEVDVDPGLVQGRDGLWVVVETVGGSSSGGGGGGGDGGGAAAGGGGAGGGSGGGGHEVVVVVLSDVGVTVGAWESGEGY